MIATSTWHALKMRAIRLRHAGDAMASIASLQQAVTLTRAAPELAEETAIILNYLADIYLSVGLLNDAEATIRQAIDHTEAEPLFRADNLLILAKVMHKAGRIPEFTETAQEALRLIRKEYGRNHPYTQGVETMLNELGLGQA